jgi:hypothetical protein
VSTELPSAAKELRDGRYVLLTPLGQGGQGTTWDAVDKREGRRVAVKAFDVRGAKAWKDVELAEREARVLSLLEHPALPRYFEHFEEEGVLYLVMERVHGTPLSEVQKKGPKMSEKDATRFLLDADRALTYLHGRTPPVIHRDLKPANVLRRTDGSYAFVDFGAVRDHLRAEGGSTVVGTFGYMAPEQFQGRASPASDVYSIGATAMTLLTGIEPEKLPHRGLAIDVAAALEGRVGPSLVAALSRMLEPDPDKRATSIGPLLDAPKERARERASTPDRRGVRRAAKRARKAAKEAKRDARRGLRREESLPGIVRLVFHLGLAIAGIAVSIALQVVVPLVLTLLSLVFGPGLRRAARSVRQAGAEAARAIAESQHAVDRVRVPAPAAPPPRVRVAAPSRETDEAEREQEEEEDEEENAERREPRGRGKATR